MPDSDIIFDVTFLFDTHCTFPYLHQDKSFILMYLHLLPARS